MSHPLKVGDLYNPSRRHWPEGANYNYRGGEHELLLLFERPSAEEVSAVASGMGALALYVEQPVLMLLYRFGPEAGPGIPWSDSPYAWHRVPEHERTLPSDEERATLRVVLVDASSGIVKALRLVLLPEGFTAALHAAIREQATAPWDGMVFDRAVARIYQRHDSASLSRAASHLTTIPAKTGERREA